MGNMGEMPEMAARRLAAKALKAGYKAEALHEYTDADGKPFFWRIRLKNQDGEKWIRPMHIADKGFVLGEPQSNGPKPIYRIKDLAEQPNAKVFVCEGEWCADALAKAGVLATTSGALDSAGKADWAPLRGRSVVIWPDNDEAGIRYALEVVSRLRLTAATVKMVDVGALHLKEKG